MTIKFKWALAIDETPTRSGFVFICSDGLDFSRIAYFDLKTGVFTHPNLSAEYKMTGNWWGNLYWCALPQFGFAEILASRIKKDEARDTDHWIKRDELTAKIKRQKTLLSKRKEKINLLLNKTQPPTPSEDG